MIRVLHVLGTLNLGGAESRIMDIYRNIDRSKVQFDFAIHTNDQCYFAEEVKKLGGNIFVFPRFTGANYHQYKKAWNIFLSENTYKIIHGHQTSTAFIYLKVAKNKRIPIRIAHSRNASKDSKIKIFTSKLARLYATDLFAVSRLAAISEFGNKNVKNNKVKIIKNGIPVGKFVFNQNNRMQLRKELNIKPNTLVLCHIGRFHPQKNHDFLIDIFSEVQKNKKDSLLLLIGEGKLKNNIEKKVKLLDLDKKILFLGSRNDIPNILSASDMLIFPSIYEGFPGVVLEAQASNLISIISSNITKEIVLLPTTFRLSLKSSSNYWAKIILLNEKLINKRKSILSELINSDFNVEKIAIFYQNFYTKRIENL